MPLFGEILAEINKTKDAEGNPGWDAVRRKYLAQLHAHTGRAVILYASGFLEDRPVSKDWMVTPIDMSGFMTAVSGIKQKELDLVLHSPGGDPDAAQAILEYLRTRFDHIRAIIPHMAMSAGTMITLGCDEIIMGEHSQLGPIDPQFTLPTPQGTRTAPAAEIRRQFEMAKKEIKADPQSLQAWGPVLAGIGPGLLSQAKTATQRSKEMVEDWLRRYMFAGESKRDELAHKVAEEFGAYEKHESHSNPIRIQNVKDLGLKASSLEGDAKLQDLVLSTFHATSLVLNIGVQKLIENHEGRAFMRRASTAANPAVQLQIGVPRQPQVPPAIAAKKNRRPR